LPSSGIIENRPQFVFEQFRHTEIDTTGLQAAPVLGWNDHIGQASDTLVEYITVYHNTGAARNLEILVNVDGYPYTTGIINVADVTLTYIFATANGAVGAGLGFSVNRTLAGGDVAWYGKSFAAVLVNRQAGTLNLQGWMRHKDI